MANVLHSDLTGTDLHEPKTHSHGEVPSGMIALWSGTIATIPSGWFLCDGNNGTPDLRDRFIAGAGTTYGVGSIGGAATHTLSVSEMPSHTHTQNSHNHTQDTHNHTQDAHSHTQDSHNHTQDAHTHDFLPRSSTSGSVRSISGTVDTTSTISGTNNPHVQNATATNQVATATNQNTTPTNQSATATNQAATATNQNTGGDGAHNNLPM